MMTEMMNLTEEELQVCDGGMAPAAIYALGFVMGTSPAAALAICGAAAVAGVGIALASN